VFIAIHEQKSDTIVNAVYDDESGGGEIRLDEHVCM